MQRKFLALAVASALVPAGAMAQSTVQLYGTVHMSLNHTKFDDVVGAGNVSKYGINSHASNFGMRSTETLGGGMSAWMQMEFNAQLERRQGGSTAAHSVTGSGTHRNSAIGLRGGFGNVYLGVWESPWAQTFRLWDVGTIGGWGPTTSVIGRRETTNSGTVFPAGAAATANMTVAGPPAFAAGTGNLGYPLWRRFSSAVFYESPVFGGLQGKLAIQPNESKIASPGVEQNPSAWSGSLTWSGLGGNARAFIANMSAKDWSSVGERDGGWTVGGGYNFGIANVGVTYERYTYKTGSSTAGGGAGLGDIKAKQWGVGVSVPIGPGRIGASYAVADDLDGLAFSDTGAKHFNIGYEYSLSKRTVLGFGIAQLTNDANAAFTWTGQTAGPLLPGAETVSVDTDQRNIFVSIRHSF